jgi:hypothetical protein
MRFDRAARATAGAVLLLGYGLIADASHVVKALRKGARGPSRPAPTLTPEQVSALRTLLPERGVVGFLSDERDESSSWVCRGARYVWLQHDVAPVVVDPTGDHPVVIVTCESRESAAALAREHGLVLRADLGNGVGLFERPRP